MPSRPIVEPLPRSHRRMVFWSFLLIFAISLPSLWFYTTGYRFDWTGTERAIVSIGGLYITTDSQDVDFFVDEAQVTNFRIFRQAAYIQNLVAGIHPVHVQGEGLQTWTKDLPVDAGKVTEAFAFTMPVVPQIRMIGEYTTATGTQVYRVTATTTRPVPFSFASTTNEVIATTSRATTTLIANSEYRYVSTLFAPPATSTSLIGRVAGQVERQFGVGTTTMATTTATTTKEWRNVRLFRDVDGNIQAMWQGSERERPYYYCVNAVSASTTPKLFGEHVYADMIGETIRRTVASSTEDAAMLLEGERVCRETISIDRKGREVVWFDFFPDSTDLVLMLLPEGLYVVEIDDRAWQNTQLLYPGTDLAVALDGGRIFVKDQGFLLEVFTSLER